jgi:hypothetical protein
MIALLLLLLEWEFFLANFSSGKPSPLTAASYNKYFEFQFVFKSSCRRVQVKMTFRRLEPGVCVTVGLEGMENSRIFKTIKTMEYFVIGLLIGLYALCKKLI